MKFGPQWLWVVVLSSAAAVVLYACVVQVCTPGETQACVCVGGVTGAQTCAADGASWESCVCPEGDDDDAADDDDTLPPDDDDTGPPGDDDDSASPPFTPVNCGSNGQADCDADPTCATFPGGCACLNSPFGDFCSPCCDSDPDCPIGPTGNPLVCNTGISCPGGSAGVCTL